MPSLPQKAVKGANFKTWAVDSINKLIDYLSSTYIQVGQGLKINRTPSGLVIELAKPAKETQNNTTGGGGTSSGLFPSYAIVTIPSVVPGTIYSSDQDFYLMGWIQQNTSGAMFVIANADGSGSLSIPILSSATSPDSSSPVCIPVPANRKFYVNGLSYYQANLGAYGTTSSAVTLTSYP